MSRPFLCCMFLLINPLLFSQEVLFFAGKVVDGHTRDLLEKTTLEVNGKEHALDVFAEFRMYVETGDTVVFSHLGYQPYVLLVADTMRSASLPKIIRLYRRNITLDEVEINNYELTDEMKRNAQRNVQIMKQQVQSKRENIYDEDYNFTLPPPKGTGMSSEQMFGVNIIALIGRFRSSKKKTPGLSDKSVVSYEEYRSTLERPATVLDAVQRDSTVSKSGFED